MTPLVSTAWLADHLDDPSVKIIDATWFMPGGARDARAEFASGHIPGAVFFGIDEICDHGSPLPHMLSDAADFAVAARRLGINQTSKVVVYDSHGLFSAPRVWWTFRAMGHDATFVLDGGLPKWLAESRPVETGWPEPPHGDFKAHPNRDLVRNLEEVRRALETGAAQVVDARPSGRFTGSTPEPRGDLRSGHMPGAHSLPSANVVTPSGALDEPDHLREAFEQAGIDLSAPIITSCGSGVTASILALALARLGRPDAAVYDGSWTEWGGRADTPVVTGA